MGILVYPLVEIAVAVAVAGFIGWWWVFLLFIAGLVLGLGIIRYAASATGRSISAAIITLQSVGGTGERLEITSSTRTTAGPPPPAQTLLLFPAGALIALPGFVSDLVGLVALLPPVRRGIARRVQARIERGASG